LDYITTTFLKINIKPWNYISTWVKSRNKPEIEIEAICHPIFWGGEIARIEIEKKRERKKKDRKKKKRPFEYINNLS